MKGVGGPLLCIGDLLSDVGESDSGGDEHPIETPSPDCNSTLQPSDLNNLFQEKYEQLNKALAGTDHSWTHLTLEVIEVDLIGEVMERILDTSIRHFLRYNLCTALETANKLVHSTNSNVGMLKDKVQELWKLTNRRDATIEAAKAFEGSPKQPESS